MCHKGKKPGHTVNICSTFHSLEVSPEEEAAPELLVGLYLTSLEEEDPRSCDLVQHSCSEHSDCLDLREHCKHGCAADLDSLRSVTKTAGGDIVKDQSSRCLCVNTLLGTCVVRAHVLRPASGAKPSFMRLAGVCGAALDVIPFSELGERALAAIC